MRLSLLLMFSAIILLSGCVRPYLKQWDETSYSICCKNKLCSSDDLKSKAQEYCVGEVITTGGYKAQGASIVQTNPNTSGYSSTSTVIHTQVPCKTYKCNGQFDSHND